MKLYKLAKRLGVPDADYPEWSQRITPILRRKVVPLQQVKYLHFQIAIDRQTRSVFGD